MTSTTNSPSSWETTASSSESAADHQYKRVFEAREVTVVTNAMAVTADDARDKMFGVTEKTWNWLEKERDKVPSNYSRPALFPNWDKLPPGLQIRSRDEANQHRQSLARRDAPYADHTYAALRANDVQNAMDWYNDIVDLSEMEDSVKSNPAQRFTKKCHDRPAKIWRPHYDTRALSGLYFLLMVSRSPDPARRQLTRRRMLLTTAAATASSAPPTSGCRRPSRRRTWPPTCSPTSGSARCACA